MTDVVALVAILTCTLFAGAATYINLVEHPARLSCGTEIAARQWAPSYASEETKALLVTWGQLHAIRSVLSVIGSIIFIWAATHE